jgi:hypothetical protein
MHKGEEKRRCTRFELPGAVLSFREYRRLLGKKVFDQICCPILDISRGGVRFLTNLHLKFKKKVLMEILCSEEDAPLELKGRVRWISFNVGRSYKFQVGVEFYPYGQKKDQNDPRYLAKIISLEEKTLSESEAEKEEPGPGELGPAN